mmetsp:Transcript_26668/g.53220  ORF Transcript_26668/g.53220 Transcript_26668/m.53220 type:complete len:127 (-) Transcript_26668:991-1371(-)
MFASKSLAIRTVQFKDCVMESAKEIDSPARPANNSSPRCLDNTLTKQAHITIMVPANSRRTDIQHCEANVRWYAVCCTFNILIILVFNLSCASNALIVKTPSSVSPKSAYIGLRVTLSSRLNSRYA